MSKTGERLDGRLEKRCFVRLDLGRWEKPCVPFQNKNSYRRNLNFTGNDLEEKV